MKWLSAIAAAFKSLSAVQKVAGWLSFIPGAGPIAGAVSAAAGLLVTVIKAFFDGLTICFANPVVFTVVAAAFAGGVWQGISWDAHKVEKARAETSALRKANQDADTDSKRRLAAAMEARAAAEEAAKAAEDRADRARADAKRLRSTVAKPAVSGDAQKGSWVPSIPALSKFGGAPTPGR